ncbi:hypothetical protein MTR67_010933 [Solanum verrucosum]|uniref:PWWP domain-containing protein n=1 Tax=Solanum verrucosum TaxID=315347 RepID=A0AAF0Q704_SOLVR|nr:hypothetical protein MTR67_010933 [Solanum verrucosum]
MSSDENTEKSKNLAGLSAEALDSETLMTDSGPGLLDEVPRVSGDNGNVDTGAISEPVVATEETSEVGNDADGDVVEGHGSLDNVSGGELASQGAEADQGPGHLVEEMNGKENVAGGSDDEMVDAVDGETAEDNSGEDTTSVKHVYAVGDFVWGKIKSHPWWPGRVYNASAASDFAMKYNQTGRLLVAYFGDGSFSWCPPSQLLPFVDNFEKMSKQSTSKSFLYAVEKTLDEISVLVEFQMTCQCISEESRTGLCWPLAVNAGIKKGVKVPVSETVSLLLSQFEPAERLKGLKRNALTNSNSNILEFAVLKSWLSAFYRAKYGHPLASYCEPLLVEGLEDKKEDQVIDANDFSIPIEVPIQGPSEEEIPNSGSSKFPMTACDKIYQKRKQKSVAELMGENAKPKGKKTTEDDSTPSSIETSEKKRKKSGEKAKGHTGSSKSVDEKIGKRVSKKSGDSDLVKTKKLSVSIPERDELGDQQDMNAGPLSRERKKSKYLSPPYTSPKWKAGKSSFKRELEIESQKFSDISKIGERMTKAARLLLSSPDANGNEAFKDDVDKSSRIRKRSSKTFDTMAINSSVDEVLSEVQSTALNPLLLRNESLEKARGFISTFRNSVYFDGSNYKQYHQVETGKKRKSVGSGNVISQSDSKSPDSVRSKKRKTNHAKSEVTKLKKESGPSSQGKEDEDDGREASSVILLVTFLTGFSLPSEDEIIRLYNKFGELNEEETKVLCDLNSVRIVYRRGSDAAQAFKESVRQSPFGAANVNFTLSYSSKSESPLSSLKARKGKSQVQLIKQKLKGMASILDKCKDKITSEEKSELENEIKGLLEKVSAATSTNT